MEKRVVLSEKSGIVSEDGILLVDKPAGISSFGVVAKVRGALRAQFGHKVKVGHTGTLDPFATGLLIILTGKMTKKSSEFLKLDKEYIATMRLGYVSSTGDPEGEIQEYCKKDSFIASSSGCSSRPSLRGSSLRPRSDCGCPSEEANKATLPFIEFVLQSFVGEISQTPPRFSAIKINGERAYKLARKGKEFEVPTREVEIYEIEILRYEYPELEIRCHVSSGTYIRTLAEDIGVKLGTGAYLTALRRTRVGEYDIKDAVRLEELVEKPVEKS